MRTYQNTLMIDLFDKGDHIQTSDGIAVVVQMETLLDDFNKHGRREVHVEYFDPQPGCEGTRKVNAWNASYIPDSEKLTLQIVYDGKVTHSVWGEVPANSRSKILQRLTVLLKEYEI